jgi:dTDP-4-amino-4,6-dideoxygalactose transaminase
LFCGPQGCTFKDFGKSNIDIYGLLPFQNSRIVLLHSGRTAINQAILTLGLKPGDEVLAPSYNCGTEVDPFLYHGIDIKLYRINKSISIDLSDLESKINPNTKAIYITHFFGFPDISLQKVKEICQAKKIWFIEDCAHALLSHEGEMSLGVNGDLAIFSFIKTLPVPDGGALVINNNSLPNSFTLQKPHISAISSNLFYLTTLRMITGLDGTFISRSVANTLGRVKIALTNSGSKSDDLLFLPENQYYGDKLSEKKLSWLSSKMLYNADVASIVTRRRENFEYLLQNLPQSDQMIPIYHSLPPGVCPLQYPVIVKNRDLLRNRLLKLGIVSIRWWSKFHRDIIWEKQPDARYLKENLMVLPIHQGLTLKHMEFMVEVLKREFKSS